METAKILQTEADLPKTLNSAHLHPSTPNIYSTPVSTPKLVSVHGISILFGNVNALSSLFWGFTKESLSKEKI